MIVVEAFDKLLPVDILDILIAAVPKMNVRVDDEYFFSRFSRKHSGSISLG
jgi:hypothetical protein